jgi:hypothetical protein
MTIRAVALVGLGPVALLWGNANWDALCVGYRYFCFDDTQPDGDGIERRSCVVVTTFTIVNSRFGK